MARPRAIVCRVCGAARWAKTDEALCKSCLSEIRSQRDRKRRYKITLDHYFEMMREQDARCAICLREFHAGLGGIGGPHVDHDHVTNEVRGLLCHGCNIGIGFLRDDVVILNSAIAYLSRFAGQTGKANVETK